MEIVRSVNDFEYSCSALADASTCVSAISKMNEDFILITFEEAKIHQVFKSSSSKCKALFYIGKPGANIMFEVRKYIPLVMQSDNLQEAVKLASEYKVDGINKIVFLPCVEKNNDENVEEMINNFKKIVFDIE